MAWLGEVAAGAEVEAVFEPYGTAKLTQFARSIPLDAQSPVDGDLNLARLLAVAGSADVGGRRGASGGVARPGRPRHSHSAGRRADAARHAGHRTLAAKQLASPARRIASAPATPLRTKRTLGTIAAMIELVEFTKNYGDFTAVQSLNLKIEAGELFGFIGPNGAGKSTTIRFLATLLQASGGEGTVNGHSVTKDPLAVRRSVGYMPDNFGVYDGMKVWEFLDFFAVAYQIPRVKRQTVIGDVLELLDLTHKREDFVNGLSRGMKQRLCLAKTLVHDPPVLILDEPSSGLDPRARLEVKALLKELRRMGKTILISSHILTELADCCTSIGIIERGQLLMHGPIDEVYRRIRGNRIVEIKFVDGMDVGLSVIRSSPHTRSVQIEDHQATIELVADDAQVAGLLEQLARSGAGCDLFTRRSPRSRTCLCS